MTSSSGPVHDEQVPGRHLAAELGQPEHRGDGEGTGQDGHVRGPAAGIRRQAQDLAPVHGHHVGGQEGVGHHDALLRQLRQRRPAGTGQLPLDPLGHVVEIAAALPQVLVAAFGQLRRQGGHHLLQRPIPRSCAGRPAPAPPAPPVRGRSASAGATPGGGPPAARRSARPRSASSSRAALSLACPEAGQLLRETLRGDVVDGHGPPDRGEHQSLGDGDPRRDHDPLEELHSGFTICAKWVAVKSLLPGAFCR